MRLFCATTYKNNPPVTTNVCCRWCHFLGGCVCLPAFSQGHSRNSDDSYVSFSSASHVLNKW